VKKAMPISYKVYDCITYDGEDCLELRLRTQWDRVDHFVIVEAELTFAGTEKPLQFDLGRYAWASSKIRYIPLRTAEFAGCQTAWDRERFQRNALRRGYMDAADHDVVIIADVDEIIRPEKIAAVEPGSVQVFELLMLYFYCDYLMVSEPFWRKVVAVTGAYALAHEAEDIRNDTALRATVKTVDIPDAGWHFSYLGGMDMIERKLERFSHQNLNKPRYKDRENNLARIYAGKDIYRRAKRWGRVHMGDFGNAVVARWFAQRPDLFAPAAMQPVGNVDAVLAVRRRAGRKPSPWEKLKLRVWNAW
jgi:beta-1,4-mannosyl-glycoprotein beta-1,4-N-acetylglucosaminyltransferase